MYVSRSPIWVVDHIVGILRAEIPLIGRAQNMLGQRAEDARAQRGGEVIGARVVDNEGQIVRRVDGLDASDRVSLRGWDTRVAVEPVGEDHRTGGEGCSILPGDAFSKVKNHAHAAIRQ